MDRRTRLGDGAKDAQRAVVVGHRRSHDALEAEAGICLGVAKGRVDPVGGCARRARIVDDDLRVRNRHLGTEEHRLLVAVELHLGAVPAVGHPAHRLAHRLARVLDDVVGERLDARQLELRHHLAQAHCTGVVAAHQRQEIAPDLHRVAGVGEQNRQDVVVEGAPVAQLHVGDEDAFFVDRPRIGGEPAAPDVDDVARRREQRHRRRADESGRHHHEVEQVPGTEPRIVRHEDVPRAHLRDREPHEEVLHGPRHRVDVPRGAGHRLRDHAAPQIVDSGGEIAGFAHDRAERGAQNRLRLLLHHRDEPIPHHLPVNRLDGCR